MTLAVTIALWLMVIVGATGVYFLANLLVAFKSFVAVELMMDEAHNAAVEDGLVSDTILEPGLMRFSEEDIITSAINHEQIQRKANMIPLTWGEVVGKQDAR